MEFSSLHIRHISLIFSRSSTLCLREIKGGEEGSFARSEPGTRSRSCDEDCPCLPIGDSESDPSKLMGKGTFWFRAARWDMVSLRERDDSSHVARVHGSLGNQRSRGEALESKASASVGMDQSKILSGEISQSPASLTQDRLKAKFPQCLEPVA
jgi:hypothetical protein